MSGSTDRATVDIGANQVLVVVILLLLGTVLYLNAGTVTWMGTDGTEPSPTPASSDDGREDSPDRVGRPGSTHEHMQFSVVINGEEVAFSRDRYQLQSRLVHFERGNGDRLHKHATGVTIGLTLETLGISMNRSCITVPERGTFCEKQGAKLETLVDGSQIHSPLDHVLQDGENVTIRFRS